MNDKTASYPMGTGFIFSPGNADATWSWPLTIIWCTAVGWF